MLRRCDARVCKFLTLRLREFRNRTFNDCPCVYFYLALRFGPMIDRSNMQNILGSCTETRLSRYAPIFIIPLWLLGQFCVSLDFVSALIFHWRSERNSEWDIVYKCCVNGFGSAWALVYNTEIPLSKFDVSCTNRCNGSALGISDELIWTTVDGFIENMQIFNR